MGYDLEHQQRIVGLLAFECPGIEGVQNFFRGNLPLVPRRIWMLLLGRAIGVRSGRI
jgi:hypothetical protein